MTSRSEQSSNRNARKLFSGLVVAVLGLVAFVLLRAPPEYAFTFESFAGTVKISARDRSITEGTRAHLTGRLPTLLQELDASLGAQNARSKLTQFNANTNTTPYDAGPRLWRVVDVFARMGADSGGALNVGHAELVTLWQRVAAGNRPPPDDLDVRRELAWAGTERMIVPASPYFRRTEGGVKLFFGDLVDGYVADIVAAGLEENGLENYDVSVRGAAVNRNTRTGRMTVQPATALGIDSPVKVGLRNAALHTLPGPALKQIVDFRTGYPSTNRVLAVTVVARDGLTASALAAALRVIGPTAGREWLAKNETAQHAVAEALWFMRQDDGSVETIATEHFPAIAP